MWHSKDLVRVQWDVTQCEVKMPLFYLSLSFDNWMTLYIYTGQPQHLYSIQIPLGLGAKFDLESLLFSYFWWL